MSLHLVVGSMHARSRFQLEPCAYTWGTQIQLCLESIFAAAAFRRSGTVKGNVDKGLRLCGQKPQLKSKHPHVRKECDWRCHSFDAYFLTASQTSRLLDQSSTAIRPSLGVPPRTTSLAPFSTLDPPDIHGIQRQINESWRQGMYLMAIFCV